MPEGTALRETAGPFVFRILGFFTNSLAAQILYPDYPISTRLVSLRASNSGRGSLLSMEENLSCHFERSEK
jgi:hypothetical protein